ncbi:MAG TPA: hypothetical protein VFA70_13330 [Dehalococcoidia bacterium]|nr:hypothetical protein [Dehalococcoidia bacterium]
MSTDELPLLPGGERIFDRVSGPVVMLEAVAPSVGSGVIFVDAGHRWGICAVRSAKLAETYAFDDGSRTSGDAALAKMHQWHSVELSAWRMDDESTVDLLPLLLHARQLHRQLSLAWTSWEGLLSDLRRRDGAFVVEVSCGGQRGVTCIRDGLHVATYSDRHPGVGDLSLLDDLARPDSAVTVWRTTLPQDPSHDRPAQRDAADALTWYIKQKVGEDGEERLFTAPYAFHEEDTHHGSWFADALRTGELRGQVRRLQLNTSGS